MKLKQWQKEAETLSVVVDALADVWIFVSTTMFLVHRAGHNMLVG